MDFWILVAGVVVGSLLGKLASLAIDFLLWFRSWAVALVAEAGKKRKRCC